MMRFYWVYLRGEYLCCLKAMSPKDAEQQAYMKHGSASKYTGSSRSDFKAEAVRL